MECSIKFSSLSSNQEIKINRALRSLYRLYTFRREKNSLPIFVAMETQILNSAMSDLDQIELFHMAEIWPKYLEQALTHDSISSTSDQLQFKIHLSNLH